MDHIGMDVHHRGNLWIRREPANRLRYPEKAPSKLWPTAPVRAFSSALAKHLATCYPDF